VRRKRRRHEAALHQAAGTWLDLDRPGPEP
jgi:hypothetical protein